MTVESVYFDKPQNIRCEVRLPRPGGPACSRLATHIYGPECESTSGNLMYLCVRHADFIKNWMGAHSADPVECPEHGRIGTVKDYLILREM